MAVSIPRVCALCGFGAMSTVERALGMCITCVRRTTQPQKSERSLRVRYQHAGRRAMISRTGEGQHYG